MSTFAPPTGPPAASSAPAAQSMMSTMSTMSETPVPRLPSVPPGAQFDAPELPPSRPRRLLLLVVAVLALVAVGVGAVLATSAGGEGGDADDAVELPPFSLAAAAEQAAGARTVEFDMTVGAGDLGAVTIEGAVDNETGVSRLTMDLGSALGTGEMPIPGFGGSVEVLYAADDGVIYLGADDLGGFLPIDAQWVSIDLAVLAEATGQPVGDLGGQFAVDPTDVAAALLDAENVVEVGDEVIDGVDTKHYQVTVDVAAAIDALPSSGPLSGPSSDNVPEVPSLDDLDLPDAIVYDVWVTEDSELRRMSFDLAAARQAVSLELNLFATGEPLDLQRPADDDVFDLTELLTSF